VRVGLDLHSRLRERERELIDCEAPVNARQDRKSLWIAGRKRKKKLFVLRIACSTAAW
jgi:hypothetical protein